MILNADIIADVVNDVDRIDDNDDTGDATDQHQTFIQTKGFLQEDPTKYHS